MYFDDILAVVRDNGKSGAAYHKAVDKANAAMLDDPERAIGYHLLIAFADRYLESTGRLAVKASQSERAFADFERNLMLLKAAFAGTDKHDIVKALNAVAIASRERLDVTTPL